VGIQNQEKLNWLRCSLPEGWSPTLPGLKSTAIPELCSRNTLPMAGSIRACGACTGAPLRSCQESPAKKASRGSLWSYPGHIPADTAGMYVHGRRPDSARTAGLHTLPVGAPSRNPPVRDRQSLSYRNLCRIQPVFEPKSLQAGRYAANPATILP